ENGLIVLRTNPPGAQIWLDTRKQEGVTPVQIGGISFKQQHMVRFLLEGYEEKKEVFELTPGDTRSKIIEVTLQKTKQ
ncbi:MAG: PEGA domain-containing protein, partial [Deltaproteobacteria bacterium]|nr:PEGA domain-containing protein [Deltaproteobacteria bacterium]